MVCVFLAGLLIFSYPYIRGAIVDWRMQQQAQSFIERTEQQAVTELVETTPTDPTAPTEPTEPTRDHEQRSLAMDQYNWQLRPENPAGLGGPWAYAQPSFTLGEYGLDDEIFGVISIPALELEMPLYLGATYQHMADGAAHLSQTSIPIGGKNTNAVIAGHRGWRGASYFRYITELKPGDEVILTNLWETLTYKVVDTQIIWPNEVEQILIQEGRDLITLLTCHPYASSGKQRYLVICERVE